MRRETQESKARTWVRLDCHPNRQTKALLGSRVRLTQDGLEQGLQGRARTRYGVVTRVLALTGDFVSVRRYGTKDNSVYHASFWEAEA